MRSTYYMERIEPNHEVITSLISLTDTNRKLTSALYERYKYKGIPIQQRPQQEITKPNNKLPHNFRSYIVDQVVGYLFGLGVSYSVDRVAYENAEKLHEQHNGLISRFNVINQVDDLDNELAKYMSACGYGARLLYIEEGTGEPRAMNLPPWEVFFLEDEKGVFTAVRYYKRTRLVQGNPKSYGIVEWHDNKHARRFVENEKGLYEEKEGIEHLYDGIPIILFQNNEEETGDFEHVEPLIDAYDKIMSDGVNEFESFAHAYMMFKGVRVDQQLINEMKKTGGIEVDENGDVKFITKEIKEQFMVMLLDRLQQDIHKFSASVDMTDESFSGSAMSGESRKWKLLDLENKAGTKSRKFSKGLRQQFKILCTKWNKSTTIDYINIFWEFKRNVPIDLSYIGDFASKVNGIHSRRTLLGQLPYIDDVEYELQLIEEENKLYGEPLEPLDPIDKEDNKEVDKEKSTNKKQKEVKKNGKEK